MRSVAYIFLSIFSVKETGAWVSSTLHIRSLAKRPHVNKVETIKQDQRQNSHFAHDSRYLNPTKEKSSLRKNRFQAFIQFLLYQLRRFLWPGLSKNFDSKFNAPLPELAPLGCPLFGNNILAGSQKKGPEYFYSETSASLGNPSIWRFYFMGTPVVSISGSENINAVMRNNKFNYVRPNNSTTSTSGSKSQEAKKKKRPQLFSSNNVMFEGNRDRHQFLRRLVGAAFKPQAVQDGIANIVQAANQQIARVGSEETSKMEDICESFALDIAWRQILGLNLKEDEKEIQRFHKAVNRYISGIFSISAYLDIPGKTCLPPYRARTYLVSKIKERITYLEKNGPDGSTLSAMVFSSDEDTKKKLAHDDIIDNALILLLAGTETTSSTLTSAMFFLGLHPSAWKKLVQEQQESILAHGTTITKSTLDECTYLEAVIKETLRMVPISGGNLRRGDETIVLDGKQIPKGESIFCNIRLTHELDPMILSNSSMDPLTDFIPERWLNTKTRPEKDFIPFGIGSRRCLGESLAMMEMRVFISVFARRIDKFELLGVGSEQKAIRWKPTSIIPKPLDGVPISVTSRIPVY